MAEKMTAVWLIILTIVACAAVPAVMIWLTTTPSAPKPHVLLGIDDFLPSGNSVLNIVFGTTKMAMAITRLIKI